MTVGRSQPPKEIDTHSDGAAFEIATANSLRARGELVLAAGWYRRAAQHLMDEGEDDRALELAKTAAEVSARAASDMSTGFDGSETVMLDDEPGSVSLPNPRAAGASSLSLPPRPGARPSSMCDRNKSTVPPTRRAPTNPSQPVIAMTRPPRITRLPSAVAPAVRAVTKNSRTIVSSQNAVVPTARSVEIDKILVHIPKLEVFSDIPAGRLMEIARQLKLLHFQAGKSLVDADCGSVMYLLIDGTVSAPLDGEDGLAARVTAGQLVNASAAYYGSPRVVVATAQTEVTALAFPAPLVRALAREFPSLREKLEAQTCARVFANLASTAPFFRSLTSTAHTTLSLAVEQRVYDSGKLLWVDGETPDGVYVIAAGEIELYGGTIGLGQVVLATVGDTLGVAAALNGEPTRACARVRGPALLGYLPRAALSDAARGNPQLLTLLSDVGVPGRGIIC